MFQGWALDAVSFKRVFAEYINANGRPVSLGNAARGGSRPDLVALFPTAHDLSRAGWALTVMPDQWPSGVARVVVHFYAENADGLRAAIGVRTIQR